jgi:2-methylcitrate dehydratase PrpD
VSYTVDPANPYPRQFTGHLKVTLDDGEVHEHRQAYFKGGAEHPLSDAELAHKYFANCAHGGMERDDAETLRTALRGLFDRPQIDVDALPH